MKKTILFLLLIVTTVFYGQDIRVDRYDFDITTDNSTETITDVGSLSSAFVRIVGSSMKGSAGPTGSAGNANPNVTGIGVQMTSTTELTFYKNTSTTVKIMVEVWVYEGSGGGAHEFIVRQRGNLSVTTGSASTSITGLLDRDKAVPIYQGWESTQSSTSDYELVSLALHVNASDEVVFSRGPTSGNITAYYAIVEFTGSAWRVGHGVSTSYDTAGLTGVNVTLNTSSTGTGGSTFDTTDWSTAMILEGTMGGDAGGETGLADVMVVYRPQTATNSVLLSLGENNARNDNTSYVHVIQNDDLVVNRGSNANYAENNGGGTYGATVTVAGANGASSLSNLSLEWFVSTSGTGTAHFRGQLHAEIQTSTTFRTYIHRSGNNVVITYGIVDLTGLADAGSPPANAVKVWNGSSWEENVKSWNGSSWEKKVKRWNGSSWN